MTTPPTDPEARDRILKQVWDLLALVDPSGDDMPSMVAGLVQTTANLQQHIEDKAQAIAAVRASDIRDEFEQRLRVATETFRMKEQRADDLLAELRRQVKAMEDHYAQGIETAAIYVLNAAIGAGEQDQTSAYTALGLVADDLKAKARRVRGQRKAAEESQ